MLKIATFSVFFLLMSVNAHADRFHCSKDNAGNLLCWKKCMTSKQPETCQLLNPPTVSGKKAGDIIRIEPNPNAK